MKYVFIGEVMVVDKCGTLINTSKNCLISATLYCVINHITNIHTV